MSFMSHLAIRPQCWYGNAERMESVCDGTKLKLHFCSMNTIYRSEVLLHCYDCRYQPSTTAIKPHFHMSRRLQWTFASYAISWHVICKVSLSWMSDNPAHKVYYSLEINLFFEHFGSWLPTLRTLFALFPKARNVWRISPPLIGASLLNRSVTTFDL